LALILSESFVKKQFLVQAVLEAIIPLLGYFIWNWNLYFIVLFYLLDYSTNEVLVNLKASKINRENAMKQATGKLQSVVSAFLLVAVIGSVHLALKVMQPSIDFSAELYHFWTYKELGIEQGYLLLPFVVLSGYQRYKLEFILPAVYRTLPVKVLWKRHLSAHLLLLGASAFVVGLSFFVVLPTWVYLMAIVLGTGSYGIIRRNQ
jgi:hypothetical protein